MYFIRVMGIFSIWNVFIVPFDQFNVSLHEKVVDLKIKYDILNGVYLAAGKWINIKWK